MQHVLAGIAVFCFGVLGIRALFCKKWIEANASLCCVIWAIMYILK